MPEILKMDQGTSLQMFEEPWPSNAVLYQPLKTEQVLASDWANCVSVRTYLQMCNLPYKIQDRENAEYMSPNGKVPFIRVGAFVLSGLDSIVSVASKKGISLTKNMTAIENADMTSYSSMVNNVLGNAELYICWLDPITFEKITAPRYGCVYPWPLNRILTYQKKRAVSNRLKMLEWKQKTLEEVYEDVDQCCRALSERLGNQKFFFGDSPTELDALVFGHLFTMATTSLPDQKLAMIVNKYQNLMEFCQTIDKNYFAKSPPEVELARRISNDNGDYDKLEDVAEIPLI